MALKAMTEPEQGSCIQTVKQRAETDYKAL